MNRRCRQLLAAVTLMLVLAVTWTAAVYASDDNSLADLGIKTPGTTVSPEFRYDIWEYTVEVPAGTKTLELDPHTTNPSATVNSVTGTTLDPDGTGTVVITVTSESGNAIEYVLNVSQARGAVDPAEAIAANESSAAVPEEPVVVQSEVETEDPRYVKVDRNSLQDAENTIEKLQETITEQRNHVRMLTYVLYALIAVSIVFLFIVISQLLRKRDIAQELAFYKEGSQYGSAAVAEDGWGEWGDDENDHSGNRKKKKNVSDDDGWDEEPANSSSSWVNQQVGTPVRPQNHPARGSQYPAGGREGARGQAQNQQKPRQQRPSGTRGRQNMAEGQNSAPGQSSMPRPDVSSRQQAGPSGETRRYEAVPPIHPQQVPKDVTKDLTRVNKAEAKAMKKAAAAEAKREAEEKKAAQARAEEAKRQALEAQRLEREAEAARRAQEEAVERAAKRQESEKPSGDVQASADGKNVKINMIDL